MKHMYCIRCGDITQHEQKELREEAFDLKYTMEDYKEALEGAGPKLKELILDRAAQDHGIGFLELKKLADLAYPETC